MKKYLEFAHVGSQEESAERLVLIVDVSSSMENRDWPPSRLQGAIAAGEALLDVKAKQHPQDQVGIVAFSSAAETTCPPVESGTGQARLKGALKRLRTESSTNMTAGLMEAEKHLLASGKYSDIYAKVLDPGKWVTKLFGMPEQVSPGRLKDTRILRVILLTDGEHNTGKSPLPVARKLKDSGVIVDCIGIGGTHKDVDEKCLKAIASTNPDGSPRYCFIGARQALIKKFEQLGNRIMLVEDPKQAFDRHG